MARDLWGFKDVYELEKSTKDMPESILKEQISLLGDKTNYQIYGKAVLVKVNSEDINYKLATIFKIVVPVMDNYEKTLLIMYSDPVTEYPVAITVNSCFEDDCDLFCPEYVCNSREEFESAVEKILSSNQVMSIIRILYSKASMLGR